MEHSVGRTTRQADSLGHAAYLSGRSSALQKANRLARTPTQSFLLPRSLDMATVIIGIPDRHPECVVSSSYVLNIVVYKVRVDASLHGVGRHAETMERPGLY